jgi:hypothetical protein
MNVVTVNKQAGSLVAFLIFLSGCASTPPCQTQSCQTSSCQSASCQQKKQFLGIFNKSNCPTEENASCCNSSDSCCNQDCQPKKFFTGLEYVQCFDNLGQSANAKSCAHKAMKCIEEKTKTDLSSDFKSGFRKAYQDIAMGRKGTTPAVPPEKYWYAYYRGVKGKERAQEWFSGYEKGVEMAKFSGIFDSRQIHSSLIQQTGY